MAMKDVVASLKDAGVDIENPATLWTIAAVLAATVAIALVLLGGVKAKPKLALSKSEYRPFVLQEKQNISRDTRLFRFALQSTKHVLGLPIGQHISLKFIDGAGKMVTRSYTPTSSDDEVGYVDFVIKVYFPNEHPKFPDGGKMSYHLHDLKVGDTIDMMGPKGSLEYKGKGLFSIRKREDRQVKRIGMLAGGTGITPMLQIMTAIRKENSNIEISLIFANQTEQDILLRDMIEAFPMKHANFRYHFTVDRPSEGWTGSVGFITADMIQEHLPPPGDDTLILMCGPPPMVKFACIANLEKLNYTDDMYFSF
eukprot:TRINITY_DN2725_c0_g1_i1.p1 TRINITY_DN2725_c0_g1~~TRINITY_DN2725_c0_g1_i1.p1  ORF type:complete len:311 (-),score=73.75 TRINITY_DN2725_c0_g1_i1:123-1055(-)